MLRCLIGNISSVSPLPIDWDAVTYSLACMLLSLPSRLPILSSFVIGCGSLPSIIIVQKKIKLMFQLQNVGQKCEI